MPRVSNFSTDEIERAKAALKKAATLQQIRSAQAILLPALMKASMAQTAEVLGISRASVGRLQSAFRGASKSELPIPPKGTWGGRRNAWMTFEEEAKFLAPWLEQAASGAVVVISPIRAALAQHLGQTVKASVVYRLLARHGWRKVAPDTRHPKSNPAAQEAWKKNSPKHWQSLQNQRSPRGEKSV